MKFFELPDALQPLVPGGLVRAPYLRELISMFTTVTETSPPTSSHESVTHSSATLPTSVR